MNLISEKARIIFTFPNYFFDALKSLHKFVVDYEKKSFLLPKDQAYSL